MIRNIKLAHKFIVLISCLSMLAPLQANRTDTIIRAGLGLGAVFFTASAIALFRYGNALEQPINDIYYQASSNSHNATNAFMGQEQNAGRPMDWTLISPMVGTIYSESEKKNAKIFYKKRLCNL